MRVNTLAGVRTALGFGPKITGSVDAAPDGLLLHENVIWSVFPMHAGMRQYWRDLDALERWTRSEPHRTWWTGFLRNSGGTGFWHETYLMRGGMEAIYDDMPAAVGFGKFARLRDARGPMFSARARAGRGAAVEQAVVSEGDLYGPSDHP